MTSASGPEERAARAAAGSARPHGQIASAPAIRPLGWPAGPGAAFPVRDAAATLTCEDRTPATNHGAARWEPNGMSATPVLDLRGIDKSFGPVKVLHDVSFTARAGEVTALVGDNGAGKSTLVKCIGGIHPFDSGRYLWDGHPVSVDSPRAAASLGIEVVHQDLSLVENLDIVQNMFLGRERRRGPVLDEVAMEEQAVRALAALSVRTVPSVRRPVATLSGGQRQTVAIARAVLWESRLVVLDEPAAALGVAQTRQVLELVRRLADRGLAVILISHNMNDVFAVSDRIAALYLGRMVAQVRTADVTHAQVVELITSGRSGELGLSRDAGTPPAAAFPRTSGSAPGRRAEGPAAGPA
jgi:D-xylose transport system ATP-binding protein